jgi:hypothetical protein
LSAANLEGMERQDAVRDQFQFTVDLSDFVLAEFKIMLARIGLKRHPFIVMLKAAQALRVTRAYLTAIGLSVTLPAIQ